MRLALNHRCAKVKIQRTTFYTNNQCCALDESAVVEILGRTTVTGTSVAGRSLYFSILSSQTKRGEGTQEWSKPRCK